MLIKKTFFARLTVLVTSRKFFYATIILLVLQAVWIALTARYPMAFDEDFHLGIIKLYADHISPFWSAHPAGGDAFGAVARDPSYLFHWLMSFPYRLVSLFTNNESIIVLILRALNIALFTYGVVLWRRVLIRTGISGAIINASLLVFCLIPVVPILAAQINYDNLLLPVVAAILLAVITFEYELSQYKRINSYMLTLALIGCLLASLVKYAFLPIFAALIVFVAVRIYQVLHNRRLTFVTSLLFGFTLTTIRSRWILAIFLILSLGLFTERFGVNLWNYHTPVPDCGQVLSYKECKSYGPWIRDYNFAHAKPVDANTSFPSYLDDWFAGMWRRLFFAVDGPSTHFQTRGPLLVPGIVSIAASLIGIAAAILALPKLLRRYNAPLLYMLLCISAFYITALIVQQYKMYVETGVPVAINGRYLLILLPALIAICGAAVSQYLHTTALKATFASLAIIGLLWGGGALTYILRSNDQWYWNVPAVHTINHVVQNTLGPVTPGYRAPSLFL